jgi:hypothetical protein
MLKKLKREDNMKYIEMFELKEQLDNRIQQVADRIMELQHIHRVPGRASGDFQSYERNGELEIMAYYEESCGSCGVDYSHITFPIEYLDDDNWEDSYLAFIASEKLRREQEIETKKKEEAERKIKEAQEKEIREREKYEELKKKYEK